MQGCVVEGYHTYLAQGLASGKILPLPARETSSGPGGLSKGLDILDDV